MPQRPFPAEFSRLLDPELRGLLERLPGDTDTLAANGRCGQVFRAALEPSVAAACAAALEDRIRPFLARVQCPLPRESRLGSETLPFCERRWSTSMARASPARAAAREIGLLEMIYSDSFLRFAEVASGYRLAPRRVVSSLFCYETGDYIGPHTDGLPDAPPDEGYVTLSFSLGNGVPATQLLMWEGSDGFTEAADVASGDTVQVLLQPAWHQVSPLVSTVEGAEPCRWMILQRFRILGPPTPGSAGTSPRTARAGSPPASEPSTKTRSPTADVRAGLLKFSDAVGPCFGTEDLALFLHSIVRMEKPRTVVELGTGFGVSALWMALATKLNGVGRVWAIDDFEFLRSDVLCCGSPPGRA